MAGRQGNPLLHVSARSIAAAVALLGLTIGALAMVAASTRVIGWVLTAATVAALLHPGVDALHRKVPRGIALAAVVVSALAILGFIGYRAVDDVNAQVDELEEALPDAAREIERSERFGELATDARLAARVETFVEELPERLRGGDTADALRSAATRGVAFLATGVLTIFFLIHGPRLLGAGIAQLPTRRQQQTQRVAVAAYRRAWRYLAGTVGMSAIAGLLAYLCARVLELPGATPLAVWVALIDIVPLVGVVLGALPIVLLAGATSPAIETVLVAVVLVGWQVVEALTMQKRVEQASIHIGPFLTIAVAMIGLELYGIGGALISVVAAVFVVATADEIVEPVPVTSGR